MADFTVDVQSLDPTTVEQDLLDWIETQPDGAAWKDFFIDSSTGRVLMKWLSGVAGMLAYRSTVGRREAYMQHALKRSSVIGIAQNLSYSAYRGRNVHLTLNITPLVTQTIQAWTIIGTMANYDIVLMEQTAINEGVDVDLHVVIGNLAQEDITVLSEEVQTFRFANADISEDFRLFLNATEVPTSTKVVDLVKDKYATLSNALGGVDVMYLQELGKAQQTKAITLADTAGSLNNKYWLINAFEQPYYVWYNVAGFGIDPAATGIGIEIAIATDATSIEVGQATQTVINALAAFSAIIFNNEITIVNSVVGAVTNSGDGNTGWPSTNWTTLQKGSDKGSYLYLIGDTLSVQYISLIPTTDQEYTVSDADILPYGNINSIDIFFSVQIPEPRDNIKVNGPLFHETQFIIRGRDDYRKLFAGLDTSIVSTNGSDDNPGIVDLTYVRDDLSTFNTTEKDAFIATLASYRVFGVRPATISDPIQVDMELEIQIKLQADIEGTFDIDGDVDSIVDAYDKELEVTINTFTIEEAVTALSYVKYSRVAVTETTTLPSVTPDPTPKTVLVWNEFFNINTTIVLL